MKYILGLIYIFIAIIVMLWALLSEYGGISSILRESPEDFLRIVLMYGKVVIFYPFIAYLAFKLGLNGISKFRSNDLSEVSGNT